MTPGTAALIAFLLVVLRALFLGAEAGISATSSEALRERGAGPAVLAAFSRLKSRPDATFAALRAMLVLSLSLAATFSALAALGWLSPLLEQHTPPSIAAPLGVLAGALAVAALTTLFDLAARALTAADPETVAARSARHIARLTTLASPALGLLAAALDPIVRPLGGKARFGPPRPPLEDLERLLVEEANRQGIDPQGPKLIRNIFEMSEKTAHDVMVPRTEVTALDVTTPAGEILQVIAEHGHSRMPVYRDEIDKIVGILHTRDLVPMLQNPELIVLQDILRPAHYIPWSKPAGEILREMQKKKIHMALVVDEYGGFSGVVTLEDVLEVIVGDIRDEYDPETAEIDAAADGSYLVRASIGLEQVNKAFSVEIPEGDYETLGGFLNYLAGCIPEVGDKFFFAGLQFTVQDRSPRRVRRVRVQRIAGAPADVRRRRGEADASSPSPGDRSPASRAPASPGDSASSGT